MGANGNRRQTLRNNIVQPYNSGFLADVDHKDHNAIMGQELDKISTATKHMFQGLDDVRKEVDARTHALDALHLTVNDQFNKVMMEISGVKLQIGQGITVDSITDADGNVLSGVLEGLKTQVNAANGNIMVALGEITNTNQKFDGEILNVNQSIHGVDGKVTQVTGLLYGTDQSNPADGTVLKQIAEHSTALTSQQAQITTSAQAITTINQDGSQKYVSQWGVKTAVSGLTGGVGFYNDGTTTTFTVSADTFRVLPGGGNNASIPFYVDAHGAHIKQALIDELTVNGAKVTGYIKSDGWDNPASSGWYLGVSGQNANRFLMRGHSGSGTISINDDQIVVLDSTGALRVKIGNLDH